MHNDERVAALLNKPDFTSGPFRRVINLTLLESLQARDGAAVTACGKLLAGPKWLSACSKGPLCEVLADALLRGRFPLPIPLTLLRSAANAVTGASMR